MYVEASGNDDVAQTNFNFEREKTVFCGCSLLAVGLSFPGLSLKKRKKFVRNWRSFAVT